MTSQISHKIKHIKNPKDVFITPSAVAIQMINSIIPIENEKWFDPFYGSGIFYNNYPINVNKDYTEIAMNKDFFKYIDKVDVIVSNPPYSILDDVLKKTIELKPRVFSYLLLHGAMTPKRLEYIEKAGYGLTHIHTCKVFAWYGMAQSYTFTLNAKSIATITYDRIVHRLSEDELKQQNKLVIS